MKKLKIAVWMVGILALTATGTYAQSASVGVGLAYGSDIEAIAVEGNAVVGFSDAFRGAADVKIFFPDVGSFWTLNANLHYSLMNEAGTNVYALAGLNYATASAFGVSNSEAGLNLGAGAEFGLGFGSFYVEPKYVIEGGEQFVISAGLRFGL